MQAQAQLRLEAIHSQFLSFHLLVIASYLLSISFYLFQLSFSFFGHLLHIPNLFYILLFFGTIFFFSFVLFCFCFTGDEGVALFEGGTWSSGLGPLSSSHMTYHLTCHMTL